MRVRTDLQLLSKLFTFVFFVQYGKTFPIFELDQIAKGIAQCDWVWKKVDGVIGWRVKLEIPPSFHVRHVQHITS